MVLFSAKFLVLALAAAAQARPNTRVNQDVARPHDLCPSDRSHFLLPHEYDCTKFYYCEYGLRWDLPRDCAPGTQFSFDLQVCVHPAQSGCTLPGVPPEPETTQEPELTTTTTPELTTILPTYEPTTPEPTTPRPTTPAPTTPAPTTPEPTTPEPTTPTPTTPAPTTPAPTTPVPTTPAPTTPAPTTPAPTTPAPTTPQPTTPEPTTPTPTTPVPTTPEPTTPEPTTPEPTTPVPTTPVPTTSEPTTPEPTTPEPTIPEPTTPVPTTPRPITTTSEPVTNGTTTSSPTSPTPNSTTEAESEESEEVILLPNGCPADFNVHQLLPHESDCRLFYYCNFGEKVERSCPSNLHFNPEIQVCDWPENVNCSGNGNNSEENGNNTEENNNSNENGNNSNEDSDNGGLLENGCPTDFDVHQLLPHESDCGKFYYCVHGEKVERQCSGSLHFNPELQVCDWPENVQCETNNSGNGDDSNEHDNGSEDGGNNSGEDHNDNGWLENGCPADFNVHHLLPHETDCGKFYYCVHGEKVERACSGGLHFNPEIQVCDWPQNVQCVQTTTPESATPRPTTTTTTTPQPTTPEPNTNGTTTTEPVTNGTTTTLAPITNGTITTPEPITNGTTTTPEPITNGTTTTSAPITNGTTTTPAPITNGTTTTPAPITNGTTTTPESITNGTTATPAPITNGTTATPAPITNGTTTTSAPITNGTTTTSAPITNGTTTTPAPITNGTTTTSAPITNGTTTTSAPITNGTTTTLRPSSTTPNPSTEEGSEESEEVLPNGCPADFDVHQLLPHESDCSKFYYCVHGEKVERQCSGSLHFNPELEVCDWPENVQCENNNSGDGDDSNEDDNGSGEGGNNSGEDNNDNGWLENGCPADFNVHHLLPHEKDCDKFYYCVYGEKVERTCSGGLHFNPEIQVCDWPQNVQCENNNNGENGNNSDENGNNSGENGNNNSTEDNNGGWLANGCPADFDVHHLLPHESDCGKFYYCVFGERVERECAEPLHFNPNLQVCDWPESAGCNNGNNGENENGSNENNNTEENGNNSGENGNNTEENGNNSEENNNSNEEGNNTEENGNGSEETEEGDHSKCTETCNAKPWAHETACDKYWRCEGEKAVLVVCAEGLHFNANSQTCDFICNANCVRNNVQATADENGLKIFLPWGKVDQNLKEIYDI